MNKKLLLTLWVCLGTSLFGFSQYQLSDFYKEYQTITVRNVNRVLDQELGQYDENVDVSSYFGANNQKWVVMPLSISVDMREGVRISNEHLIGSKENGKILKVYNSNNLACIDNFHIEDYNYFEFANAPDNHFRISSPFRPGRSMDRTNSSRNRNPFNHPTQNRDNIYMGNTHGETNQQFSFANVGGFPDVIQSLRYARTTSIPKPANPTSFTSNVATSTTPVFVSEAMIPYPLVNDDTGFPINIQVNETPYYRLEKTAFYRQAETTGESPVPSDFVYRLGQTFTRSVTVKVGTRSTKVEEVVRKIKVSFSPSKQVGGLDVISEKIPIAFKLDTETTVTVRNEHEESYERTATIGFTDVIAADRREVVYLLIHRYNLYRMDGSVALTWDVVTSDYWVATFPATGSGGGGGGVPGGIALGSIIDDGDPDPDPIDPIDPIDPFPCDDADPFAPCIQFRSTGQDLGSFVNVYPNPSEKGIYTVNFDKKLNVIRFEVYNMSGKPILRGNTSNKDINLSRQRKGVYLMKIYTKDKVITKRLIKN